MQNPPISSQSWPFPSQLFLHFSQDFSIIVLIGSLATGYPLWISKTINTMALTLERLVWLFFFLSLGEFGAF